MTITGITSVDAVQWHSALGIELLPLLWGAIGGFVLQAFRPTEATYFITMIRIAASAGVSAAFAPTLAEYVITVGNFQLTSLPGLTRTVAFTCGACAQGLVLALADGVPDFLRAQVARWKKGGP